MTVPSRKQLVALCERAVVDMDDWSNRDSAHSQEKIGQAWALLKAGCEFTLSNDPVSDKNTWWIEITYPGFNAFEEGRDKREYWESTLFYIPTNERLRDAGGKDWY